MRCPLALFALCSAAFAQANEYNPIYRENGGKAFTSKPNAFLVEMTRRRKPGTALDVGMGQGRNAIYLAQRGWNVTGFDPAGEGVNRAKAEAERLGLRIQTEITTFEKFEFGENRWYLIVLTYEPTKAIAPRIERALKPGGAVLIEDRHVDTRRVWPAGAFADNELVTLFPNLRVLRYEDVWARPDWSVKKLDERLVRLLAEKPIPREPGCVWEEKPVPEGGSVCWETLPLHCTSAGWQIPPRSTATTTSACSK